MSVSCPEAEAEWVRMGLQVRILWGSGMIHDVAFRPGGMILATAGHDGAIAVWDAQGGSQVASWAAHTHGIAAIAFSPDGRSLATASGSLKLCRKLIASAEGHSSWVRSVAFSCDGKILASASGDRTVKLWEVQARPARGLAAAGAARGANLEVIAEGRRARLSTHPFYWCGFIAAGDWGEKMPHLSAIFSPSILKVCRAS